MHGPVHRGPARIRRRTRRSRGDTVELFGPGRGEDYVEPTADDWARAADTISYEIFTCLRNRIPRLYEHAAEVLPAADLAKLDPATLL